MIATIAKHESMSVIRSLQSWVIAALLSLLFGFLFLRQLEAFITVQATLAQQDHPVGLTGFMSVRYLEPLALAFTFIAPLFAMRSFSDEYRQQTFVLWQSSPVRISLIVIGKFLGLMFIQLLLILLAMAMLASMRLYVAIDLAVLLSAFVGLLLVTAACTAAGLYFSSLTRHAMIAIVASLALLLLLWLVGSATATTSGFLTNLQYIAIPTHLHGFFQGFINTADVAYFVLFTGLFLVLTMIRLDALRHTGH